MVVDTVLNFKNNQNPNDLIYEELKVSWENNDQKLRFLILLRIGKML